MARTLADLQRIGTKLGVILPSKLLEMKHANGHIPAWKELSKEAKEVVVKELLAHNKHVSASQIAAVMGVEGESDPRNTIIGFCHRKKIQLPLHRAIARRQEPIYRMVVPTIATGAKPASKLASESKPRKPEVKMKTVSVAPAKPAKWPAQKLPTGIIKSPAIQGPSPSEKEQQTKAQARVDTRRTIETREAEMGIPFPPPDLIARGFTKQDMAAGAFLSRRILENMAKQGIITL